MFFDLYGTILIPRNNKKSWNNWLLTFYTLMRDNGLTLSRKKFADTCSGFFTKEEPAERDKNLTIYEDRIKSFGMDLKLDLNNNEIKKIANRCATSWHKYVELDPDAIPLLNFLKNKKNLALITNFDHPPFLYSILSKYKLIKYFEFIAISGEIGVKKPDPQIFNITLEKVKLKPLDVVFIGDNKEDVEGAINASIEPILIQHRSLKKRMIGNDYFSKKKVKEKKIVYHNSKMIPFKTISRLRELYQILNL